MTMGELARLFNAEKRLGADLHVVPMDGYRRGAWYDQTGLPWMAPSPNLRSIRAAALYPGVAILEGANVSVGRGTDTPFELVGAPWIDGARFAARLAARGIAGVRFEPATFVPDADRYRGQPCHGIRLVVADRDALDAPALGVELLSALHALYPGRFEIARTLGMLGSRRVLAEVQAGLDPRAIAAGWTESLRAFQRLRAAYLLY
jgi:uncharacterized protein YbbC (DUF1343 family)